MPSRRELIEMTREEIRNYLKSEKRLIVASINADGLPHPMPMNFMVDDQDRLLITTFRKTQKTKNIERLPKATLLVESGYAYAELKAYVAYADAEIISDAKAIEDVMAELGKDDEKTADPNSQTAQQVKASIPKRVVIRFTPYKEMSWDHSKLAGLY